jgi:multimeric flavodoxin WrbA
MKYLILSGNPKSDGLCHSFQEAIEKGASEGGAEVEVLKLDKIERCHVCSGGWGTCREKHVCAFGSDGFDNAQQVVKSADKIAIITPVYWQEVAEGLKSFIDRLRRCEFGQNGALSGKEVLLVASAGGSGNGTLISLEQLDRFSRHTGAIIFDYISVNRWNSDYKRQATFEAAKAMASGRKNGDTV